jgi:hypothetical protein
MKTLFTVLALALTLAQTAQADEGDTAGFRVRENGGRRRPPSAVSVSFASIGSGVDDEARAKVRSILGESLAKGEISIYSEIRWGMEGESTICADFFSMGLASDFSRAVAEIIANGAKYTSQKTAYDCTKINN